MVAASKGSSSLATFVATLPPAVVLATWGALRHLQPFGLTAVMRIRRCWRPLTRYTSTLPPSGLQSAVSSAAAAAATPPPLLQEMSLGPNALRQLEIVSPVEAANGDGTAGTLLRLMDRTHTAFGSRLLRRWLVRPLCRRDLIMRRQTAVSELLDAGE